MPLLRSRVLPALALAAALAVPVAAGAAAGDGGFGQQTIKRDYSPVRTRVRAWDGERPERAWSLDSVLGLGAEAQVGDDGPLGYRERIRTVSFLFAGTFELSRLQTIVSLRIPFVIGSIVPILAPTIAFPRSILSFGNITVEGGRLWRVARDTGVRLTAVIACPTIVEKDALAFGGLGGDAAKLARASLASRGYESPEQWVPGLWALAPTLSVLWRAPAVRIEPFAKAVAFVDPASHLESRFRVEAVVGVRSTVRLARSLDLGLRTWGRLPLYASPAMPTLAAGAELRAHLPEQIDLSVGAMVPLATPHEQQVWGVSVSGQIAL